MAPKGPSMTKSYIAKGDHKVDSFYFFFFFPFLSTVSRVPITRGPGSRDANAEMDPSQNNARAIRAAQCNGLKEPRELEPSNRFSDWPPPATSLCTN